MSSTTQLAGPTSGNTTPVVSVIIPGLNVATHVGDALFSLTRQFDDPRDMEVIFIDDGSSDGSGGIVESHSAQLPNLHVIRNERARGISHARNQGMSIAKGRYISFLDADDWFAPGHLTALVDHIERIGCDFLRTDVIKTFETKRELKRAPQARRGVSLDPRESIVPFDRLTMVDHTWSQAGLYDRRLIDSGLLHFSEKLRTAEDRLWTWTLHLKAHSYAVVNSPGFVYRQGSPESLTQQVDRRRLDYLVAFDLIRVMVEADPESDRFIPKVIQSVLAMTEHHLEAYDQMEPDVQLSLVHGAHDLLSSFREDHLVMVLGAMPAEREHRLARILDLGVGRLKQ